MNRTIIALAFGTVLASVMPALAGPNGSTTPSFFPLSQRHQSGVDRHQPIHALLGDIDQSSGLRAIPPGVTGKAPARGWQRRPSEGN
jgi:hypothetical protein